MFKALDSLFMIFNDLTIVRYFHFEFPNCFDEEICLLLNSLEASVDSGYLFSYELNITGKFLVESSHMMGRNELLSNRCFDFGSLRFLILAYLHYCFDTIHHEVQALFGRIIGRLNVFDMFAEFAKVVS